MSRDFLKVFGHKLRMTRKIHFKTQLEVGKALGKTKQTISKYENGTIPMNVDTFEKLVEFYGMQANVGFFFRVGERENHMLEHIIKDL